MDFHLSHGNRIITKFDKFMQENYRRCIILSKNTTFIYLHSYQRQNHILQVHCYDIVPYSLDKNLSRLKKALTETKLIHWNKRIIFPCARLEFKDPFAAFKKQVTTPFICHVPSFVWWLPKEKALKYEWRYVSANISIFCVIHYFTAFLQNITWQNSSNPTLEPSTKFGLTDIQVLKTT